ncbi:MAG: NAD(+) synthase [Eubacterium sp.]|nr:NAD(+) synthase [Eubacterium sp.]
MKYGFIKAAACSPKVTVADPRKNAEEIIAAAKEAAECGAKIIAFPELAVTGSTCGDAFRQQQLIRDAALAMERIRQGTRKLDALIIFGLPMRFEGRLYNAAAVLSRGKIMGFVPKENPQQCGDRNDGRYFVSGEDLYGQVPDGVVTVPFSSEITFACEAMETLKVAVTFGGDEAQLLPKSRKAAATGAFITVCLDAAPEIVGKAETRRKFVSQVTEAGCLGYIYTNASVGESTTDYVYAGRGMIAEDGEILAEGEPFLQKTVISEIDLDRLAAERDRTDFAALEDDGITVWFPLRSAETVLTRTVSPAPFIPEDEAVRNERCRLILQMQAQALAVRMKRAYCDYPVLGISGGLDSTTALLVTAEAVKLLGLPAENVIAVTMPCFGTTDRTYTNACELTKALGATLKEVDIKKAVLQHFEDIGHDPDVHDTAFENAQARERTQVLMDIANMTGGFVVGTGDLSELCLGWATYNGDHMSMYDVNGGVPKTLMRVLVGYVAETCTNEEERRILKDVLDTPISPELLPAKEGEISQKTEDLVGPYRLHDFYIYYCLRYGYSPEKIFRLAKAAFAGEYDDATLLKWLKNFYRRFFASQFKRSCLSDGPKIGSVGVSPRGDLVLPSDACRDIWLAACEELEEQLAK